MTDLGFDGRVAIITGAGGGLGREHALLLASRGALIVVNDLGGAVDGTGSDKGAAERVVGEIKAAGGEAVTNTSSVATAEGGQEIVQAAIDAFGKVDIVINNAGILRDKAFTNMDSSLLDPVIDVHLRGAFHVTQPAWVRMKEQGYGRVISTSSAAGIFGNFGQTNYGAAKMGLVGLTRVLAVEGAKYNIKANAIAPLALTRMTESIMGSFGDKLDPALISPLVTYLAHEDCPVTGQTFSVGGGRVAHVFIGEAKGYYNPELSPEDVRDNWETVTDQSGYAVPNGLAEETALFFAADEGLVTATPTVDEFQQSAQHWLAENASVAPPDYGAICPDHLVAPAVEWQRRIHAAGFAGVHWPAEFGGRGLTPEHNGVWLLECARAGVPPFFNMVGHVLAAGAITRYGTDEQKRYHLDATARGDRLWCQLFSEPGAGSDLGSLTTRAERDGERFVVNGQKVWTSSGRYSHWGILMARTDPEAKKHAKSKHEGISFFVIPMDLAGIEVRPLRQMTGEAEFDEVFFTDVELPAENLLGPLHDGWGVGMAVLTSERGHIGTAIIGLERRLDAMASLAEGRELGPIERQRLATLMSTGSALKALAQRQGPIASIGASLMKLGITEMMFELAMLRGDLAGADAMLAGPSVAGMLSAPGGRIAGGTSQVQRNIIGERLLGLPREPKPA